MLHRPEYGRVKQGVRDDLLERVETVCGQNGATMVRPAALGSGHANRWALVMAAVLSAGFVCLMVVMPLGAILRYGGAESDWTVLADDYYQWRILWTVLQAALTCGVTACLGVPLAWVLARFEFRGRRLLLRLLMLPFVMPTLVAGMGVLALFGPKGLLPWDGSDTPWLLLYGNVFFNLPLVVRAVYQGLASVPANRIRAARTLGAGGWRVWWQIEWPVQLPWLAGGLCLVFLYCFSGFGLALVLGGAQYATVEVEIYQLIAHELDVASASVLVWVSVGCSALAALAYAVISRRAVMPQHRQPLPLLRPQGWRQRTAVVLTVLVLLLCCAAPLLAIVWQAAQAGASWQVLGLPETHAAVWNTTRFTAAALCLTVLLGVAHAAVARRWMLWRTATFLPFMVSPVCVAFGLLLLYPQWTASIWLLVATYALLAYPFVAKDVLAAWDTLPERYAQAARVLGARPSRVAWRVTGPLLLPALRRGLTFAAASCVGEFAATLFLSRPEWQTLTTLIYRYLGRAGAANHDGAMVLSCVLMLVAMAVFMGLDSGDSLAEPERRRDVAVTRD